MHKDNLYISNRKETSDDLKILHVEIFNNKADPEKIRIFEEACHIAYEFVPSERCHGKKCVIGPACGNLDSKVMFIAEAPGRNGAERTGIPIYGDPSGDNFEIILNRATNGRLTRRDVYITNTFLWNPTNEQGNNDRPTKEEILKGLPFLKAQIDIVKPELIIALGNTAYKTLGNIYPLPSQGSLREMAGKVFRWTDELLLGIMYHPSPRVVGTHRTLEQMITDMQATLKQYLLMRKGLL